MTIKQNFSTMFAIQVIAAFLSNGTTDNHLSIMYIQFKYFKLTNEIHLMNANFAFNLFVITSSSSS